MRDFKTQFNQIVNDFQTTLREKIASQLDIIWTTLDLIRSENVATESQENPELRDLLATEVAAARDLLRRIEPVLAA